MLGPTPRWVGDVGDLGGRGPVGRDPYGGAGEHLFQPPTLVLEIRFQPIDEEGEILNGLVLLFLLLQPLLAQRVVVSVVVVVVVDGGGGGGVVGVAGSAAVGGAQHEEAALELQPLRRRLALLALLPIGGDVSLHVQPPLLGFAPTRSTASDTPHSPRDPFYPIPHPPPPTNVAMGVGDIVDFRTVSYGP